MIMSNDLAKMAKEKTLLSRYGRVTALSLKRRKQ